MAIDIFTNNSFWKNIFKAKNQHNDVIDVLRKMPPFQELSSVNLLTIYKLMHQRVYKTNEMIFHQGDPGTGLYIIISGQVAIKQIDGDKSWDLAKLVSGDFFGELALLDDEPRSATAIALENTQVIVIFKPDLDSFIQNNPKEGIKILKGISHIMAVRLRNLNQDLIQLYKQTENN